MPEPPASIFEQTPQTSRRWTAGARRSDPSSSLGASGSGSRPRTLSEHRTPPRREGKADDVEIAVIPAAPASDRRERSRKRPAIFAGAARSAGGEPADELLLPRRLEGARPPRRPD